MEREIEREGLVESRIAYASVLGLLVAGGIVLVREGEGLVVESGVAGCGPCASGRDGVVSDAIAREFAL